MLDVKRCALVVIAEHENALIIQRQTCRNGILLNIEQSQNILNAAVTGIAILGSGNVML